jgi:hypothetical protein
MPLIDLSRLAAGIRWRKRIWAVLALVGLAMGIALGTVLPARVSASAVIYVIHESEDSTDSGMSTDLALLKTTTVAEQALANLRLDMQPEKFVASYGGVIVAPNLLEVTASGDNEAQTLNHVQAIAKAFIAIHVKQSSDAADAQVKALTDVRDQVQQELSQVNGQIAGLPVAGQTPEQQALVNRRSALSSQVIDLTQRAELARIGSPQVAAGTKIIDTPHITSRSMVVAAALYGVIGAIVGLGVGLAIATVASIVRDRPVLRRDIAANLGASVIAQFPAPLWGPQRLVRRLRPERERRRVAATLARAVRQDAAPISVLELGCPSVAAALVMDMAEELSEERPVTVVDDLPGDELAAVEPSGERGEVTVVAGPDFPSNMPETADPDSCQLAIATVGPGTPWTDLRRLGAEAVLVVRAGSTEASWMHTVARQLADADVSVIGVVLVNPDPRDRSDGTIWDALHYALRGRLGAQPPRRVDEPSPVSAPPPIPAPPVTPPPATAPLPVPPFRHDPRAPVQPVTPSPVAMPQVAPSGRAAQQPVAEVNGAAQITKVDNGSGLINDSTDHGGDAAAVDSTVDVTGGVNDRRSEKATDAAVEAAADLPDKNATGDISDGPVDDRVDRPADLPVENAADEVAAASAPGSENAHTPTPAVAQADRTAPVDPAEPAPSGVDTVKVPAPTQPDADGDQQVSTQVDHPGAGVRRARPRPRPRPRLAHQDHPTDKLRPANSSSPPDDGRKEEAS